MKNDENTWEYFGQNDPYYGVYTVDEMHTESLDETSLAQFFESGEVYIERIWAEIERHFIVHFSPERSLDFGCGVGRLALPIARRSGTAIGVDISKAMLKQAAENAVRFGIANVEFVKSGDELSKLTGKFDFVHSYIVLQHVDPKIGVVLFCQLVEILKDDGIGVLHVQYANSVSTSAQKLRSWLYRKMPLAYSLRNLILRKRKEPNIPTYLYDLNKLLSILQANDCHSCQIRFSEHGPQGCLLFFQKKKETLY